MSRKSKGPSSEAAVSIAIAGIALRFTLPEPLVRVIGQRYANFITAATPRFSLSGSCTPPLLPFASPASSSAPVVITRENIALIRRADFHLELNLRSGRGRMTVSRNIYSFDTLLRVLLSAILGKRGGFLIHGAGLVIDRKGYAFAGISGSGKSTLTRLRGKHEALSDEILAVTRAGKGYAVHGTPFWGELKSRGRNTRARLSRFFFLEKGDLFRTRKLKSDEAIKRLLQCALVFEKSPAQSEEALASAEALVKQLRPEVLVFPKSKRLPAFLAELAAGSGPGKPRDGIPGCKGN